MMTPEQSEAIKCLHNVIKFEDRKYRKYVHQATYGKTPMQQLRALHTLVTKHSFTEAKFKQYGILPKECITDMDVVNAAIDVQRYWNFDMQVWQYVGVYMTEAHIKFRKYYLSRAS